MENPSFSEMEVLIEREDGSGFLISYEDEYKDSSPSFRVYSTDFVGQEIEETDLYLKGTIKWDGCSHLLVGPDIGYLHLCGYHKWKEFSEVMEKVWEKTVGMIDNFDFDSAEYYPNKKF